MNVHLLGFGKQCGEVVLVGFAELPEVVPSPCDIGADVKHDDALVSRVARRVLLDGAHDAANELNEGTEVGENAADHRYGKVRMIESLAEHSGLHDGVEFVTFKLLKNALVRLALS